MVAQPPRQSDRVSIVIPIQVLGTDVDGATFTEEAQTLLLSRTGAAIVLKRKLAPQQEIIIRRRAPGTEADARVVGQMGGGSESYVYGVELLDPTVNLWGIEFPPLTESEKAVGRVLLECGGCQSREVVYLGELEAEVFEANRCISRPCKACRETTLWKEAQYEAARKREPVSDQPAAEAKPVPAPPLRTQNERKRVRVSGRMTACIRHAIFGEEVVATENVSRGGLCFKSRKSYPMGSSLEVALPYSLGPANIFIDARIVYARELPSEGLNRYGVAYLKTF